MISYVCLLESYLHPMSAPDLFLVEPKQYGHDIDVLFERALQVIVGVPVLFELVGQDLKVDPERTHGCESLDEVAFAPESGAQASIEAQKALVDPIELTEQSQLLAGLVELGERLALQAEQDRDRVKCLAARVERVVLTLKVAETFDRLVRVDARHAWTRSVERVAEADYLHDERFHLLVELLFELVALVLQQCASHRLGRSHQIRPLFAQACHLFDFLSYINTQQQQICKVFDLNLFARLLIVLTDIDSINIFR